MATEVNIQESACLKKGEREENALASEMFEEKVTELPGTQVKQLDTSSYVAEIVNTSLVTGKPTDESGIFFQALSVTMVIADEHSNAPESCNAAKQTEPEDKETIKTEEKAIESVTGSQDAEVEDIKETTTEHATIVADVKEQDLNATTREFVKEETEGKSVDAQEVTEQCEIGSKNIEEQKSEESVEKIEKDEEIKEIKADIETEKREQNGLLQAITSDAAISTQTKSQAETTEHEEEDTQKSDNPLIKEVCEENVHEVVKSKESIEEEADVDVSTQPTLVKESIKTEEPDDEKATEKEVCEENSPVKAELEISDTTIEKEQGDVDGVTSSLESPCVDAEETTTVQHVTTTVDSKEHDLDEKPKEFIKEETEDKSLDATEASEECVKEETEQNPEESVDKTEKEKDIKPGVVTEEKREQDELLPAITADVCIPTQTKSQVETTEHGEKEQDVSVLEKDQDEDDITHAQEVTFEKSLQEESHHKEDLEPEVVQVEGSIEEEADEGVSTQTTLVKESFKSVEPDDEKAVEKEICEISDSMQPSLKDQGDSGGVTSLQESPSVDVEETATVQHVTTAVDFKEQDLNEKPREFVKEETEDKSLDAPEEKEEQDELLPAITKDENEDGEKEQEVNVLKKDVGENDVTSARDVTFEKDLQEENHHNEDDVTEVVTAEESTEKDIEVIKSSQEAEQETLINAIPSDVCISTQTEPVEGTTETGQGLSATQRETIIEEAKDKSVDVREEIEQYGDGTNDEKEQKLEVYVNETAHSTKEQEEHTDEIKPKVEATEEKDVGISTQTESQQEATKNEENAIESDDVPKQKSNNTVVSEVCEQIDVKQTESKEQTQFSDSSDVKSREIVDEDTEETKSSDVIITDVSSSTQTEYLEKAIESKENNDETEEGKPQSPLVEVECEATSSKIAESEEVKHSESSSTTLSENETMRKEEIMEKEDDIKTSEVKGGGVEVTSSQDTSSEDIKETTIGQHDTTMAHAEEQCVSETPKEIAIEEAEDKLIEAKELPLELGQPNEHIVKAHPCLSENLEDEIKKDLSHESLEDTNDSTTKEEGALEHEPVEEHSGLDEVPKENVADLNESTEVKPQEDIAPSISLEASTEDTSNSEKEKAEIESLPVKDLETVSEPNTEESVLKAECSISETETYLDEVKETVTEEISSDETSEIKQETVREVCEETGLEKAEFEGVKLFDTSNVEINKKEITTYKDDDQAVKISAKIEGNDNITSSQHEDSEDKEGLQEKNDHNEDNEENTIKSGEGGHEDTEEIKSSAETKEDTENVIATTSSTQIEPTEETTENNDEKAIENDKNEIMSREIDLEEKLEDVCSLAQTEPKEETAENKETNEEAICDEKEQESAVAELQGDGNDVVSSRDAYNDDKKETEIGQDATTPVHAEEASEQSENETKDKIEQHEESVNKHVYSSSETVEESIKEEEADSGNKEIESKLEAENQADSIEDRTEIKDEAVLTEKVSKELEQSKKQNVDEIETCLTETISENTEDMITKDEDLSNDSVEKINENITKEEKCFSDGTIKGNEEQNDSQDEVSKEKISDLNETTAVEPREDVTPSCSLETSTEDTKFSDKTEAVNENLPIEDLESVTEEHIPEVMPKSEDSKTKEECPVSVTDIVTVTKEISSYETLETHGSTLQPENSYSTPEENVTQSEIEDCSETVKDIILTEEIEQVPLEREKEKEINDFKEKIVEEDSYSPELEKKSAENQKEHVHEISNSDSIPAEHPEVSVDGHMGQEDLQGKEDISCVSKVTTDVDQEPKEEGISSLEDDATVESEVDLSNRESTAYPLATRALESDCDVQIPEVVADSEDPKVKEECVVLATAEYTDENNVKEQDTKTDEISSAPDIAQETVTEAPTKSDEAKSSDLIIEEKAITKENLEIHGELEPESEPVIDEQVITETKPQPEQSEITCENITNDENSKSKLEEEVTLAPENAIKSIESQNETTKNIILSDEVVVESRKENEVNEIERQVSEKDS
ncbi:uncharacterized protein LOC143594058, partial [Bidens hawaiensis]|uniref:uncharacterized protein LOC143594058 n=1 Tax=Bidens hawaiensis TaxID=980011 RepID=UPI00404ADC93